MSAAPIVHLYTVCWDEADMLGFFFRHYDPWVSRYVVYDDGSTDGSREILARHPRVELRRFDRANAESFVLSHKAMQDHSWKESRGKADWVVVTAIDEHLHVAGRAMAGHLADQARRGVTLIPALGFDMNAPAMPADEGLLTRRVTRGRPRAAFNKLSIFDPSAIEETVFGPGRHSAEPTGRLVLPSRDAVMLWHYKHLGFARNAEREASQALRLGRVDVANGYGQHYLWTRDRLRAFWNEMEAEAADLSAPGLIPDRACAGPLWWRAPAFPAHTAPAPKVSVAVKAYDHAPYVAQTIQSVLDQSLTDFEIVATDDGSADETLAVLRSFDDPRMDVLALGANHGISAAMNATVARARGDYVAILNSDDWALPGRLARQAAFLDANPGIDAVFGLPAPVDERGEPTGAFNDFEAALTLEDFSRRSWLRRFFYQGNCLCSPTAMIRRSAYDRAGPYDPRLTSLQDFDMWIRMLAAGSRFHLMPEPVTAFRIRDGAANASAYSAASVLRTEFELTRILERFAAFDDALFDEVFGGDGAEGATIPARIGDLAMRVDRPSYRFFALTCLHRTAERPEEVARLRALTGSIDLFGEWTLAERDGRIAALGRAVSERDHRIADLETETADRAEDAPFLSPQSPTLGFGALMRELWRVSRGRGEGGSGRMKLPRFGKFLGKISGRPSPVGGRRDAIAPIPAPSHGARVSDIFDPVWYVATYSDLHSIDDPAGHYARYGASEGRAPHPLFDPNWYARNNPGMEAAGLDPLAHFVAHGHDAGQSPHPLFDVRWYLDQNPDVRAAGHNALVHYIRSGASEGRSPHPLFDVAWYRDRNPASRGENPLIHYALGHGRDPHPLFDEDFYRAAIPDFAALGCAPLTHYLSRGAAAGFDPNPLFDSAWYLANHETLAETGENPLAHYVRAGAAEGRDPHPLFDAEWYAFENSDVARNGIDLLTHYLHAGRREGRRASQPDRHAAGCAPLEIPYEIRRAPPALAGRDACVFVTYSADGRISAPTTAYVEALRENGVAVVLVIATDGIDRPLPPICDAAEGLVIRANHGWDFAAWATALAAIPDLWSARCLILANDSVFGPTDPSRFSAMLDRVRASHADVIALTDSHQVTHHLMSYFIAIKNAGLTSGHLHQFWSDVRSLRDKQEVIDRYELAPVARLAEAGLTHEVLFPGKPRTGRASNPTLDDWRSLVARGFPFLKVQLLRDRLGQCDPQGWRSALDANPALLRHIEASLSEARARKPARPRPSPAPRRRFKRNAALTTFYGSIQGARPTRRTDIALEVPFRHAVDPARLPERVAVVAHIFYPDLCGEIRAYLANIPVAADLFVSTDTDAKRVEIERAFAGFPGGRVTVRVFPNVGRDIAPMLVGFSHVFDAYEVFLHIHSKKSPHAGSLAPWRGHLLDTLLGSREIVASILRLLAEPDVGIVFPEHFDKVRSLLNWGGNYDLARGLLKRAGADLSKDLLLEFPSSSFYWGRSAALRPLLGLKLGWSDFPAEAGQIDGTIAHAIERSMLLFAEASGHRWVKVGRADRGDPETLAPALAEADLPRDLSRVCRSLLRNRLTPLQSRSQLPNLTSIATRPDRARERPRLNLILPTLKPEHLFGGITTAVRIFEEIGEALGAEFDLRILCQTLPLDLRSMLAFPEYRLVQLGAFDDFRKVIVDVTDQDSGELDVRRGDVFLATAWWTAVNAYKLQAAQSAYFGAEAPVLYLIQDHEPDFHGWSTQYGLAQETYSHGAKTIALINSEELAGFMTQRYALPDARVIRFKINPSIAKSLTPQPRERIICVYGRPGTPRNAFPTLMAGIGQWQQANPVAARSWRIVSAGEEYPASAAGAIESLSVVGKLSLDAYGDLLSRASVGISLMLSPHPSYPPLEMAMAGLLTITNAHDGKDLSRRCANILSIPHPTPDALAQALEEAVSRAEAMIGRVTAPAALKELPCAAPDFDAAALAGRLRQIVGKAQAAVGGPVLMGLRLAAE